MNDYQQRNTDRSLDWYSEWGRIADALSAETGFRFSVRMEDVSHRPLIYLDTGDETDDLSLFVKPHPDRNGEDKALVGVHLPGQLTDYRPYDEDRPSIGLTYTKGPENVARDIARRLIEDADEYHQLVLQNRRSQLNREDRMEQQREALEEVTGEAWRTQTGSPHMHLGQLLGSGYGKIKQSGPDSYRFDMGGITYEQARKILELLSQ